MWDSLFTLKYSWNICKRGDSWITGDFFGLLMYLNSLVAIRICIAVIVPIPSTEVTKENIRFNSGSDWMTASILLLVFSRSAEIEFKVWTQSDAFLRTIPFSKNWLASYITKRTFNLQSGLFAISLWKSNFPDCRTAKSNSFFETSIPIKNLNSITLTYLV